MTTQPYPAQIDCVWIASDRHGHIGAFVTAGIGPIPRIILNSTEPPLVADIEEALLQLPKVSGSRLLVSIPQAVSFIEMAERGLFVYDWTDVHRTTAQSLNSYEPVALPLNPVSLDVLTGALKVHATRVKFETEALGDRRLLNVRANFECVCS